MKGVGKNASKIALLFVLATAVFIEVWSSAAGKEALAATVNQLELLDPEGDPFGPGTYTYDPAYSKVYRAEYFDMTKFSMEWNETFITFSISFKELADPLNSSVGFSPQVVHIYVVGKCSPKRSDTLGLNVRLRSADSWCACVIVAPNLGAYVSSVVLANGSSRKLERILINENTIQVEVPRDLLEFVEDEVIRWRYFVAVTAYDPESPDGLIRVGLPGSGLPVIHNGTNGVRLELLPRVLDVLAETAEDQYTMLSVPPLERGDIATVAAYPYAAGLRLPHEVVTETTTLTATILGTVTETYVKLYELPGVTTTVTSFVQVPKYGTELYTLAFACVALVLALAYLASKTRFR